MDLYSVYIYITLAMNSIDLSYPMRKCSSNCSRIIQFSTPSPTLRMINSKTNHVKIERSKKELTVYIGTRKVYNKMVLNSFGIHPILNENVFMVPTKKEMQLWIQKNQCQIGIKCKPDGDCWGSGATQCHNNALTEWVSSSHFQHAGSDWYIDLFRTCVKDWECSLRKEEKQVYQHSTKGPYVMLSDEPTFVNRYAETYDVIDQNAIYIDAVGTEDLTQDSKCLVDKKDTYCEITLDNSSVIVSFVDHSSCTSFRNFKICLEGAQGLNTESKISLEDKKGDSATIGDLEIIGEELRASMTDMMYNAIQTEKKLNLVTEILNKVIHSIARFDDMLVHDLTGNDVSTVWTPQGLKVCECLPYSVDSCEWSKNVLKSSSVNNCHLLNDTIDQINLFGEYSFVTLRMDHLNLTSVDKRVLDTMMEKEALAELKFERKKSENGRVVGSFTSVMGFDSVKDMFWSWLPLLNLFLVINILSLHMRQRN